MSEHRITYITAPTEVAEQIAHVLVEENLAVCINVIALVTSIYKWEGQVEKAHESLLIVKAMTEKTDDLIAKVREIHPYEIPEVISFDITAGNPDYLDWLSGKEVVVEDAEFDDEDMELEDDEELEESDEEKEKKEEV